MINRSIFRAASGRDETSYYLLPCQSKILLGTRDRHGHGEEDNMAMNREQTRCEYRDWFHPVVTRDHWRAVVNSIMNHGGP